MKVVGDKFFFFFRVFVLEKLLQLATGKLPRLLEQPAPSNMTPTV